MLRQLSLLNMTISAVTLAFYAISQEPTLLATGIFTGFISLAILIESNR